MEILSQNAIGCTARLKYCGDALSGIPNDVGQRCLLRALQRTIALTMILSARIIFRCISALPRAPAAIPVAIAAIPALAPSVE
jgi:hypothetical protein